VLDLLTRSAHDLGVAVVMATHSAESTAAADRVVKLRDGRIAAMETPRSLSKLA
jgi:ABC-type lipoprotein export system ATPase subunit